MVVKILCSCGTKYKFDVEPRDGKLPGPVNCPACGAEGTAEGNEIIARELAAAGQAKEPAATEAGSRPRTVVPVIPKSSKALVVSAAPAPAVPSVAATVTPSPPTPPIPPTVPKPQRGFGAGSKQGLGIAAAVAAGLLGMLAWYGITVGTNREFGLLAWGLGGLIGAVTRAAGAGGSRMLGLTAGAVAFVAILGGQYLATRHMAYSFMSLALNGAYDGQVAYAKEVTAAKNDAELKAVIAKNESDDETTVTADDIDAAELAEFRKSELPELQQLSSGKMSKAQFERKYRQEMEEAFSGLILKESFSLWTLLWLFLGVGTAFRLGSGR